MLSLFDYYSTEVSDLCSIGFMVGVFSVTFQSAAVLSSEAMRSLLARLQYIRLNNASLLTLPISSS